MQENNEIHNHKADRDEEMIILTFAGQDEVNNTIQETRGRNGANMDNKRWKKLIDLYSKDIPSPHYEYFPLIKRGIAKFTWLCSPIMMQRPCKTTTELMNKA